MAKDITDQFINLLHYNKDFEKAVLGACLLEVNAFGQIQGILNKNCFYYSDHQEVYAAISAMWQANFKIDILTVVDFLAHEGSKIPLMPFVVTELTNAVVSSSNMEYHAFRLKEMFCEREIIRIKHQPFAKNQDALDKIQAWQTQLNDLTRLKVVNDWSSMEDVVMKLMAHMEKVKDRDLIGSAMGYRDLDLITGGLVPGNLYVIGARPSVGKSAFLNGLALEQAANGENVGIISLEMPKVQLGARMGAHIAGVDFQRIYRNNFLEQRQRDEVYKKLGELASFPIFISDKVGVNVLDIKAKAAQLIYKKQLSILYIDYLQLVEPGDNNSNREQQVSQISRALKLMAMDFNIPVIILAQLNRETEKNSDKKPQLHNLRESGSIEQDADGVMFLHRDWKVGITENEDHSTTEFEADLIVAKWRNGEIKSFKIGWDPPKMRFYDLSQESKPLPIPHIPDGRKPWSAVPED